MSEPIFRNPATLPTPPGYSQVVEVHGGRLAFVAGQVALDRQGKFVGENDFAVEADQVFSNLNAALEACGGGLSNILKLTVFLTDMQLLGAFRQVRDRHIPPGPKVPASTLVEVSKLFRPQFHIEVEAIAWFA